MFAAGKTSSSVFIQPAAQKEAVFTAVGTTNWTVPTGVTSISVVCIGGGGSGSESTSGGSGGVGGDLRYYNNLSVTPGETLAVTVGGGGAAAAATGNAGGFSNIARAGVTLLEAAGSYGDGALNNTETGNSSDLIIPTFGGGGGGSDSTSAGNGGQGCVRIVWPGDFTKFPSSDVWMSRGITTVIETQSATSSITIPASALAGDLAVLMNMSETVATQSDPSGWTRIINLQLDTPVMTVWYRILQSGDANTAVTMTSGTSQSAEMLVFRKAFGTISSVNAANATVSNSLGSITSQVKPASTSIAPLIVFGALAYEVSTMATSDMYFTGGLAGTGNTEPSVAFSGGNGDTTRQGFMRFRIYDTAPSANVTVVSQRSPGGRQTMGSFILGVT